MDSFENVVNFFCNMHCAKCYQTFTPDGIELISQETNFYVVKITCTSCGLSAGIAIVAIRSSCEKDQDDEQFEKSVWELVNDQKLPPINYNDVIDAHNFFSNLGSDWSKHIDKVSKDIDQEELSKETLS